ncbi:protein YgfX [Vibrio mexicanus]|uniref:protein YgfX n=1 Tax=Vibrio mexicanus TaxID=1004326 RepID=UPI0012FCEEF9|nr:protein YgfX [Vibrio mexicanus]
MSLITSAKFDSFHCRTSSNARIASLLLLLLAIWAIVTSPLAPLPALLLSLALIYCCCFNSLTPPAIEGSFSLSRTGEFKYQDQTFNVTRTFEHCGYWFVVITMSNGHRFTLWRDSLPESDYRLIKVISRMNKQE